MVRTVAVEGSSAQVVAAVWSALLRLGYQVERSFDLQAAIAQHPAGCGCSFHGSSQCGCQYVVLLAYLQDGRPNPPRVITVHANEKMTWVTLLPESRLGVRETHLLLAALAAARARPEAEKWATPSRAASAIEGEALKTYGNTGRKLAVQAIYTNGEAI